MINALMKRCLAVQGHQGRELAVLYKATVGCALGTLAMVALYFISSHWKLENNTTNMCTPKVCQVIYRKNPVRVFAKGTCWCPTDWVRFTESSELVVDSIPDLETIARVQRGYLQR